MKGMKLIEKIFIFYYHIKLSVLEKISIKKAAAHAFRLFITPISVKTKISTPLPPGAEPLSFMFEKNIVKGYRWASTGNQKVLILHGFSSTLSKFMHYVQPLVDKGMEVLAFDAPAHGMSTGKTVNVLQYRDMIEQVVKLYGPVHAFIAHSFGGLALSLYAEQLSNNAELKIVLIAPATETNTAISYFSEKLGISQKLQAAMKMHILERSGIKAEDFSVRRAIKQIKSNILWIHDLDDDVTPWKDAEMVKDEGHKNIRFVNTTGLGHRRIYKDETVAKTVIEFIN
jgi:alpha-beta hydrolase superfamily lysophospholipase